MHSHSDYAAAGATISKTADVGSADVVLKVRRPPDAELKGYKSGAAPIETWQADDAALSFSPNRNFRLLS